MRTHPRADRGVALVVEDEPRVRAMAAEIFNAAGYRAIEACDAAEAMTFLESCNDIQAVFTDIEMPGHMTGVGLANTICQRWPHIRVLVTSGCDFPGDGSLQIRAGFMCKPDRRTQILAEIR